MYKYRNSYKWMVCLLALICVGGCSDTTETDPKSAADIILAEVGSRMITLQDVLDRVQASDGNLKPQEVLNQLIRRNAMIDTALDFGLGESNEVIAVWENALIRELRRTQLDPAIASTKPAEREIRSLYEREFHRFQQPERRNLALVLLPNENAANLFVKNWEEKDPLPIESGFGDMAFQHSIHDHSRYDGGKAGWLLLNSRPPGVPQKVVEAAFSLQTKGEISQPFLTENGWGIVRLLEIQPAATIGYETARPTLEIEATRELRTTLEEQFFRRIKEKTGIQLHNQEILKTLEKDLSAPGFRF